MSSPKTLLKAVTAGRTRQVRLLLDLGSSTEEQDDCGQTPLIRAVFVEHDRSREKIMRMLLKKGALVSRADVVGRTALSWACLYGRDKDVALLIDYADVDVDYNKVDINGQTALFHATSSGNAATVKLMVQALKKYDLSVDVPDFNGITPFMHATRLGHDVCASILVHNGNARAGFGQMSTESFTKKEKWAVSSLRERSKVKNYRQQRSQFPPIVNKPSNDNRDDERLGRRRGDDRRPRLYHHADNSCSDLDSGLSSDEEESSISSKMPTSVVTPRAHDPSHVISSTVLNCLQNIPPCGIPPSILASPTCSSLGNASSGDESEVDSVASTIIESKMRSPGMDLSSMYKCKQDQMTHSYRQHVLPVVEPDPFPEPSDVSETVSVKSEKQKGRKDKEVMKWLQLKKTLRLTSLVKPSQSKNDVKAENDPKQPPTKSPAAEIKKPAALPNILPEKRPDSANRTSPVGPAKQPPKKSIDQLEMNVNYSEV